MNQILIDGVSYDLPPLPFAVLLYLVKNNGVLVTRKQIMENIWVNSTVTSRSIDVAMSKIRKTHETIKNSISTVINRGYKFSNSDVRIVSQESIENDKIDFIKILSDESDNKYVLYNKNGSEFVDSKQLYESKYGVV